MRSFEQELARRLQALEDAQLRRHVREIGSSAGTRIVVEGRELLNFSSNDYLGLATHPKVKAAAAEAAARYGAGSGASRLICGSLKPHHQLEEFLAAFKGTEAALVFSTGYATALGTIPALLSKDDIVVIDKLVHASIVDAAKLSGAKLRVFAHNDTEDLEAILRWCDQQRTGTSSIKIVVVTESLFSMDGDFAPLKQIVALKEKYGAWLMVDEAHATGLFGEGRRGLCEHESVSDAVEIQMGTLGKAVGSAGGYIAGSRVLIDYLVNKARSFIFSTAPPPSVSAAAQAGLEVIRSRDGAGLAATLHSRVAHFIQSSGFSLPPVMSPILPYIVGAESAALALAAKLLEQGVFVPAIRYPTVARNTARLRITFSAAHSVKDIEQLAHLLAGAEAQPKDK